MKSPDKGNCKREVERLKLAEDKLEEGEWAGGVRRWWWGGCAKNPAIMLPLPGSCKPIRGENLSKIQQSAWLNVNP